MLTLLLLAQISSATPRPAPPPAPTPTVRPKVVGAAPGSATSLSDFAKGRKIDTKAFATPPVRAQVESPSDATQKPGSSSAQADTTPEDERLWRGRAEKIHRQIAEARAEAEEEKARTGLPTPGMRDPQLELLREAAAEKQNRRIQKLEKDLAALAEECRRTTGCLPGWVR